MGYGIRSTQQRYIFGCAWNTMWLLIFCSVVYALVATAVSFFDSSLQSLNRNMAITALLVFLALFFLAEYFTRHALLGAFGGAFFWGALHYLLFWLNSDPSPSAKMAFLNIFIGLAFASGGSWPSEASLKIVQQRQWEKG